MAFSTSMTTNANYTVCPKCSIKHVRQGLNTSSYCPDCRQSYNHILYELKRENPYPEDHNCEICGKHESALTAAFGKGGSIKTKWRLDHCHETKQFRGFLCENCNMGLGKFMDDIQILRSAIIYLERSFGKFWGVMGGSQHLDYTTSCRKVNH